MKAVMRWGGIAGVTLGVTFLAAGCKVLPKKDCDECGAVECADGCFEDDCSSCNGCGRDKWHKSLKDFDWEQLHSDHCWPEQYAREAARRVNAPLGQQMINGIEVEQTVWKHYFSTQEGKESQLNSAGEARLTYLSRRKPYVIPQLFLETSFDPELDSKRAQAVVDFARTRSLEPLDWQVSIVNRRPAGLFGREAPKNIEKMIGPGAGPPVYEGAIKKDFFGGAQ
ncbi:hypothetical protein [Planctomycetes bacterium Pan216]